MKHHHIFAFALAAALTAAPAFAHQETDKQSDAPKAQAADDKDKAAKPEAKQEKQDKTDNKAVKNEKNDKNDKDRHDANRMPQSDQEPAMQDRDKDKADKDKAERDNKGERGGKEVSERDRNAHVTIKSDAKDKLREHYARNGGSHTHTVTVVRQQILPVEVRTRVEPVPVEYVSYLGPAPEGFMYGFVDGYVVLYDPDTFFVVDVLPLW